LAYARVLINRQRYAEATTQLEQATQQQPNNPESWLLLASLQLQDNLLERAEQALQQFMTQPSNTATATCGKTYLPRVIC